MILMTHLVYCIDNIQYCGELNLLQKMSTERAPTVYFKYLNNKNKFFYVERNECSVQNGGCSHNCKNTKTSYQCVCPYGYMLSDDQRNCKPGIILYSHKPASHSSGALFKPYLALVRKEIQIYKIGGF